MNSLSFYLSEKVFISFSILQGCFIGCRVLGQWFVLSKYYIFHSTLFFAGWFLMRCLSSVTQLFPTLWDPMDCSMPGFPVHHQLLELAQTHAHRVSDAFQTSHPLLSPSLLAFNLPPQSGSFPINQFFASGGQSIGVLASSPVLSMNIQGWFPLGLTSLISLLSKGLSRVFSSTTFESINYSALSFLYGPTLTSICDYWKNHSFDYTDLCW